MQQMNTILPVSLTRTSKVYLARMQRRRTGPCEVNLVKNFRNTFIQGSTILLTWEDMIAISGKLREGKSSNSFFTAEHILCGSPKLMVHLHLLFNALLQHSFVPSDFLQGTISPLVKDILGDLNALGNYRGVTLCSLLSRVFECALRLKFGLFLLSDDLQFEFKPRHSTSHAAFTLS